jgi:hypothetical protein
MWLWSDGSGDILEVRFTDATGQTFQPYGGRSDWHGWRWVAFALNGDGAGHWGGAEDGVVHYPIRIDTALLIDSQGGNGAHGTVYCTGLALTYSADGA